MDPLRNLVEALDREEVERARRASVDQKFLAGFRLFQRAVSQMRVGIRHEHPNASDEEVARLVRQRLDVTRGPAVAP